MELLWLNRAAVDVVASLDGTQRDNDDDDDDDDARMSGDRRGAFVTTCIHAASDVLASNNVPIMTGISRQQGELVAVLMT
jgi:hypothetical protein